MATHTWVDLHMPEAALLADLNGVAGDLRRAREYADMVLNALEGEHPNLPLVEPLSIAMAVTYARAFSGGVRYHLNEEDLAALSDSQRAHHQFFRDYRDKHLAHSVNEFEENLARAYYCIERVETEGITSVGYGGGRLVSLGSDLVRALIEITHVLEDGVRKKIKIEEEKLFSLVRSIPIETVLAGGQKAFMPALKNVSRRRAAAPSKRSSKPSPDKV